MKTFRVVLGITVLAVTVALGARGTLNHFGVHAAVTPDLATFGSISDLPANPGVVYEAPLAESAIKLSTVSARQAIDVAENEFGLADGQIDPTARVVPVIVSVGGTPYMQDVPAYVVVSNAGIPNMGGPSTPHWRSSSLCIIVSPTTGKYVLAYACGSRTPVQ